MPVAAGIIVKVLGDVTVKLELDNWQKHNNLPAPEPVELRIIANLISAKLAPDAVKVSPVVV
tara:strand:- start:7 stop:192 length:186 start_codon:yes stop_codon:yes gene_type:complete